MKGIFTEQCYVPMLQGVYIFMFHFQQQTSGLFLLYGGTSLLDVQLMDLFVMGPASWSLGAWWNMANTPMNCMNFKLADGNGKD